MIRDTGETCSAAAADNPLAGGDQARPLEAHQGGLHLMGHLTLLGAYQ